MFQHILALTDVAGKDHVSFNSSAWNLLRMSHLDRSVFPPVIQTPSQTVIDTASSEGSEGQVHLADPYLAVRAHPPSQAQDVPRLGSDIPLPETAEAANEALANLPAEMPAYDTAVQQVKGVTSSAQLPEHYSIVTVPLGTGSAIPSKYRNGESRAGTRRHCQLRLSTVSATLVDIPGTGHILLDAGEGTLGQLRRRFRDERLEEIFANLRMIVISHMHADHHIGIRSVVEEWVRCTDRVSAACRTSAAVERKLKASSWSESPTCTSSFRPLFSCTSARTPSTCLPESKSLIPTSSLETIGMREAKR